VSVIQLDPWTTFASSQVNVAAERKLMACSVISVNQDTGDFQIVGPAVVMDTRTRANRKLEFASSAGTMPPEAAVTGLK